MSALKAPRTYTITSGTITSQDYNADPAAIERATNTVVGGSLTITPLGNGLYQFFTNVNFAPGGDAPLDFTTLTETSTATVTNCVYIVNGFVAPDGDPLNQVPSWGDMTWKEENLKLIYNIQWSGVPAYAYTLRLVGKY